MLLKEVPNVSKPEEDRKGMKDYYKAKIEEVSLINDPTNSSLVSSEVEDQKDKSQEA
jgi:hypothetical protein